MRAVILVRCLVFSAALAAANCGGSSSPSPSPGPSPSPSPGTPGQVTIVGQQGANSFNPNPSTPGSNGSMMFSNADGVTHRIVANDGSWDTGNIGPGGSSAAMTVPAAGSRYHCSLHTSMVGVVDSAAGGTPPCTGQYC